MSLSPAVIASVSVRPGFVWGTPPDMATSGLQPTSINTFALSKGVGGAIQFPNSAAATIFPG